MTMYDEEWVMSRKNRNHGLLPIKRVLAQLGDPQDSVQTVHIAGTNGKGSVTNYLKEILMAQGYTVGMFTSPHLVSHRDRIRINDDWIPAETFQKYLMENIDAVEKEDLGMFEIDCLIAFLWFKDQHVDYALIESGLGGRLDNTNVILHPQLEIITTIAYDHMNILGSRIQQIAFEKAGIIQPDTTCVLGYLPSCVKQVICRHGARVHASVVSCPSFDDLSDRLLRFDHDVYEISSLASYQKNNAALALESAWLLGIPIHNEIIKQALCRAHWAGRFEIVSRDPLVVLDGAHNEEGMRALISSFDKLPHPRTVVFSALKDKPGMAMAELLKENCDHLIVTQFANARADTLEGLKVDGCQTMSNWKEAVNTACRDTDAAGSVVITGSLYFISLVRAYLQR